MCGSPRRLKLIFEVEHFRNGLPGFVWCALGLEQFGHGGLPASVDLGTSYLFLRDGKIIGLCVADEQAILTQEERVVAPAGVA